MKDKKLPDFLIVGAAKCGTTSLVNYIDDHPEIFICSNKEPKYLTFDFLKDGYKGPGDKEKTQLKAVKTLNEYYRIFQNAQNNQTIGEASVDSIYYYKQVIPKIKNLMGDPKIIIMLRNPVKRAISAYSHLIRDNREKEDFSKALDLESYRLNDGYEYIWGYTSASFYYESVKAYMDAFTNVKVIIFEEFITSLDREVKETLNFLGVKSDNYDFSKDTFNASGKPKNKILNKFLTNDFKVKEFLKLVLGKKTAISIKNKIQKRNLEKIIIEKKQEQKLFTKFEEDIANLEQLLGKDLSIWKPKP